MAPLQEIRPMPLGARTTSHQRSIPSLDGLRAVSVSFVILAHYGPSLQTIPVLDGYLYQLGQLGVSMFFVISGFLITFLLCKEFAEQGTLSLGQFYARRAFRIFPAFYVYLGTLVLLSLFGMLHLKWKELMIAGLYLWNYYMVPATDFLTHSWSLALEEQFYLFWPLCLKMLKPARAIYLAVVVILIEPVARVASYVAFPGLRDTGKISAMFQTRLDTIMFGCLIGLLWRQDQFKSFVRYISKRIYFLVSIFLVLCISPVFNLYFRAEYHAIWLTVDGILLSYILIYVVAHPFTSAGRFLNTQYLRYIGTLSYSLYLWQQMFINLWHRWFPLNLLAAVACAIASFYLIEKPALRLRDKVIFRHKLSSQVSEST